MNKFIKNILSIPVLATIIMAGLSSGCSDDDLPNGGEPRIRYVRVTDPEAADSLIVAGRQGGMIAVVGENLGGTIRASINGLDATIIPTNVSDLAVLLNLPNGLPDSLDNKLTLYFRNGGTLQYDFVVSIGRPVLTSMKCEFVTDGGLAELRGDNLYPPMTVTFDGGNLEAEVIEINDEYTRALVEVPAGATPGTISITNNYGEVTSDFWFRDNRNVFINFDATNGGDGESFIVSASDEDELMINGNYTRVVQGGVQWWTLLWGGNKETQPESTNIPDEAVTNPADFNLKFEVNTLKPYDASILKIRLGTTNIWDSDWNNDPYFWQPPFNTEGVWETVTIPFEEVVAGAPDWEVDPDGYTVALVFNGPGPLDADMAFDTFRVVPKELDDE